MKRVYVRFYDQENLGDDLFLQMLSDRYENEITVRKSYTSGSFTPKKNVTVYRESHIVSLADRVLSRLMRSRLVLSLHMLRKHDLLVHIGGSLFMETDGPGFWKREERFYRQITIPYYILGSNVGPVQTTQFIDILRGVFSRAEDVCFRDSASYGLFEDIPATRLATDIVFALDTTELSQVSSSEGGSAVISVIEGGRKFDAALTEGYENELIAIVKKLVSQNYEVTLMSFCKDEGDETVIEKLLERMDAATRARTMTLFYSGDLSMALNALASSDLVIASRFHATILGLLFGKKVLPMAYSDKTLNILKDMDFQGPVVDIRKIDQFDAESFDFDSLQVNNIDAQKELAEKQFQELDKVLTRRK